MIKSLLLSQVNRRKHRFARMSVGTKPEMIIKRFSYHFISFSAHLQVLTDCDDGKDISRNEARSKIISKKCAFRIENSELRSEYSNFNYI